MEGIMRGFVLVALLLCAGCSAYTQYHPYGAIAAEANADAALAREQTALIRDWRECLKRSETEPSVDCSQYRTAIQIVGAP